jgi:hypothetical protein
MAGLLDYLSGLAQTGSANPYSDILSGIGNAIKSNFGGTQSTNPLTMDADTATGATLAANAPTSAPAPAASPNVGNTPSDLMAAYRGSASPAASAPARMAPTGGPALQVQNVDPGQVAQVNTTTGSPSASDYNADGTQAAPGAGASGGQPAGGLLGSLAGAASDAVTDPVKSKGFLGTIGGAISGMGEKLQNMSPAASQGLIAAGMTMLANNNGRNNLLQLVGQGGSEGLNTYQQVNANRIAMAKNAMDVQHMQNQDTDAANKTAIEAWKTQHPFTTLSAGQMLVQPGISGTNGAPGGPIATGGVKAAGSVDQIQPDGSTMTYKTDEAGQIIPGTGIVSKNPNTGPVTDPGLQKTINDAQTSASTNAANLNITKNLLTQLQGVDIPAGLYAKGQNLWSQVTGDQTTGQTLRNMVQTDAYQNMLKTWKGNVGGRLTNADINILKNHMPSDTSSSQAWTQYLTSFGKLQADAADQSTRQAAFLSADQNRGDMSPLRAPLTVGGVTYPKGTTYQQVTMGQGGTQAQQPGQNGINPALAAEAAKRGFVQNANGQWVASQSQ